MANRTYMALFVIFLLACPLLASVATIFLNLSFFASIILFLILPSIVLSLLNTGMIKKVLIFSSVSILFTFFVDYLAHLNGAWVITNSLFPKVFGAVPPEQFLWGFFYVYLVVMFYVCLIEGRSQDKPYYPRLKYIAGIFLFISLCVLIASAVAPSLLKIHYIYLIGMLVWCLVPVILALFRHPRLWKRFIFVGAYFFWLTLTYEVTALKRGFWEFPSKEFLGWVTIFGARFPIDELINFCVLSAMAIISYYELFDNHNRW